MQPLASPGRVRVSAGGASRRAAPPLPVPARRGCGAPWRRGGEQRPRGPGAPSRFREGRGASWVCGGGNEAAAPRFRFRFRPCRAAAGMINAILVFNNHGKPRLVRFYRHLVRGGGLRAGGPGGAGGVRGRGRSVPAGGGGAAADPPRHLPYGAAARRARLQLPGVRQVPRRPAGGGCEPHGP